MYGSLCNRSSEPGFGLLFDVDGVLVRGKSLIPAARRAFQKLLDSAGNFLLPVVFVTNAGNCLPQKKAEQLSHLLDVQICQEQVVLSHNPLRMCTSFHDKCVLVSGQGPVLDIANNLGFQKAVSIEQLRQHYPLLDMVDHNRRPTPQASPLKTLPKVEAVILFGEPIRWETNLQLVIDVLLTNGKLDSAYEPNHSTQLPVLACNMDLVWMADAPSPRFGHGMFLLCLESVYRKFTGRDLRYEALIGKPNQLTYMYAESVLNQQAASRGWSKPITSIYAVGDNLMTDIYGANLFNCYLAQQHAVRTSSAKLALQGPGCQVTTPPAEEEMTSAWEAPPTAKQCHSVLVCTGVYSPHHPLPSDQISTVKEKLIHSQWDFCFDPTLVEANLVEPHHIAEDVEAAVEFIFQQEGFNQK
ncbi:haloacid dehalogenase-like hydrolase domain-containing 5 [Lampris incognitus]|uniref:haloacid dehalogenase-like hydrolase domain-containing 5 n=1 Tax=Lampris incognitus TaxID=2546036 RepID=UPI0024B5920C|nr:haloacid dehalogenase-like hydrolase domain-containing 5 [Lampris incognitus]